MTDTITCIKDMSLEELKDYLGSLGEKPFRAAQVYEWMFKDINGFSEMTNLSKDLRNKLEENAELFSLELHDVFESKNDGTRKLLFKTADNEIIEAVFMEYRYGNSICISTQAGCKMGCSFCASGLNGLTRNLSAGEMVDQLILAQNNTGKEIRNIIFMGIGEPFDNYNNVKKAIENLSRKEGIELSRRHITVSTCGLIPTMERFAKDLPQVNLAISLHAPNDNIRKRIMPVNSKYGVSSLIQAAKGYVNNTGRRITFEYALIKDLNDSEKHAEELATLLKGLNCHVNLIPFNSVAELNYHTSPRAAREKFFEILENKKIQVTMRRELGTDIDAACGQLRLKNK